MSDPIWDNEKGTVTLVKGEDTKTFDLNKAEDQVSFMKMSQRGWYYDDEASKELGTLRSVIKNWDNAIEAAKNDDEAMKQLVGKIELAVGRSLTKTEKKDLNEGEKPKILMDEDENSNLHKVIDSQNKRIESLEKLLKDFKKSNEDKETQEEVKRLNEEAAKLEKTYSGDNGTPKFEKTKVFEFAAQNQITDIELAFKMMNYDKLTEAAKKSAIEEFKKQSDTRKQVFTEKDDIPDNNLSISQKTKTKSYHQLGVNALKSAKEKGMNLFTTE